MMYIDPTLEYVKQLLTDDLTVKLSLYNSWDSCPSEEHEDFEDQASS